MGIWISKCGNIEMIHSELLGYTTPYELKHDDARIKQNISYHYCDEGLFKKLINY